VKPTYVSEELSQETGRRFVLDALRLGRKNRRENAASTDPPGGLVVADEEKKPPALGSFRQSKRARDIASHRRKSAMIGTTL